MYARGEDVHRLTGVRSVGFVRGVSVRDLVRQDRKLPLISRIVPEQRAGNH